MSCEGSLFRLTKNRRCRNCGKYFAPSTGDGGRVTPLHEPAKGSTAARFPRKTVNPVTPSTGSSA